MLKAHTLLGFICLFFTALALPVWAADAAGVIEQISGQAKIVYDNKEDAAAEADEVLVGDKLITLERSELLLRLSDGTIITMRPNSTLVLSKYHFSKKKNKKDHVLVSLLKGGLRTITGLIGKRASKNVKFRTPTATIGIRGTDFEISILSQGKNGETGTYSKVYQGATYFENKQGKRVDILVGQVAYAPEDESQSTQPFGLMQNIPNNVFMNGAFDNQMQNFQQELMNRIQQEMPGNAAYNAMPKQGAQMPYSKTPMQQTPYGQPMPNPRGMPPNNPGAQAIYNNMPPGARDPSGGGYD